MPNWCHNTLTVRIHEGGDPAELDRFVKAARPQEAELQQVWATWPAYDLDERPETFVQFCDEMLAHQPLSFQSIVPMPDAERENWYGWRIRHWGSKWDASFHGSGGFGAMGTPESDPSKTIEAMGAQVTPETVVYKFDTAWSPPSRFVERASWAFPMLEFELKWAEVGSGTAGIEIHVAGEEIREDELEVDDVLMPEEQWF